MLIKNSSEKKMYGNLTMFSEQKMLKMYLIKFIVLENMLVVIMNLMNQFIKNQDII